MYIDLENAVKEFKKYVADFDVENYKISLKIKHTLKVMQVSEDLAKDLKLNQEDVELASLIGLLHDIGRFEQVKQYNTFVDKKSIDHGELGVKILFEQNLIRRFVEDTKYDEIIKIAILNHNKGKIEDGLDDRKLLFSKMIRDADKIDIFRVLDESNISSIYGPEYLDDKITDQVLSDFKAQKLINYDIRKTKVDILVCHIAYIFDLYFDYSVKVIYENDYIERLIEKANCIDEQTKEQLDELVVIINEYMKKRIA